MQKYDDVRAKNLAFYVAILLASNPHGRYDERIPRLPNIKKAW